MKELGRKATVWYTPDYFFWNNATDSSLLFLRLSPKYSF
jgi:hypothetical protein